MPGRIRLKIRIRPDRDAVSGICAVPANARPAPGPARPFARTGFVLPAVFRTFAGQINEKEEKMKADSITSPIRKQGFRASMTVKW